MMKKQHMIDVLFVLALFAVFALSTLCVVYIGLHIYQNTTQEMERNFTSNTALNYVVEKIRQNNLHDQIQIGQVENQQALCLYQEYNDQTYVTYIYEYKDQLCELFMEASLTPSLEAGDPILEVTDFALNYEQDDLLKITLSFKEDKSQSAYLALH